MDEARWERIEQTIEYLTNQQAHSEAKFSAWIDQEKLRMDEFHRRMDEFHLGMEELRHAQSGTQILIDALFALQEGTQRTVDRLTEKVDRISEKVDKLADSQTHTDERLNALIGFVDSRLNRPPLTN